MTRYLLIQGLRADRDATERKGDAMTDEQEFSFDFHAEERELYESGLEMALERALDGYTQGREVHFEDHGGKGKPELKWLLDSAVTFAEALLKATGDLVSDDKDPHNADVFMKDYRASKEETLEKVLAEFRRRGHSTEKLAMFAEIFRELSIVHLDQDSPARLVWEHLCIKVAEESIDSISHAAHRLFDLWRLVISASPCPASQQFLRRVSRCYVAGFDTECVILCRSVLDTTFRERKPEIFTLYKQIESVADDGDIPSDVREAAHRVRLCGKKAVHYEPNLQIDALDVIRDTLTVVEAIAG